jgi:hypothetical protein
MDASESPSGNITAWLIGDKPAHSHTGIGNMDAQPRKPSLACHGVFVAFE